MKKADLSRFIKTQASLYSTAAINMIAATAVVIHQRGKEFDLTAFKKEVSGYLSESKAKRLAENAAKAVEVLKPVIDPLAAECETPDQLFDGIRKVFQDRKYTSQNKLEQALFPARKPNLGGKKAANPDTKPGTVQTVNQEQPTEAATETAAAAQSAEVTKTEVTQIKPVAEAAAPSEPDHEADRVGLAMQLVAGMDEAQLKDFAMRFAAFVDAARKAA